MVKRKKIGHSLPALPYAAAKNQSFVANKKGGDEGAKASWDIYNKQQ